VFCKLYDTYKNSGWIISKQNSIFNLGSEVLDFLESVWEKFGQYSGEQLEFMTHHERPWLEAREGLGPMVGSSRQISNQTIFNFYNSL